MVGLGMGSGTFATITTTRPDLVVSADARARTPVVPGETPVISPVLDTVAIVGVSLVQRTEREIPGSPETAAEARVLSPTYIRTVSGATTIVVGSFARSRTTTFAVASFETVPSQHVTLTVTLVSPTVTPVMTPEFETVATDTALDVQVTEFTLASFGCHVAAKAFD